MCYCIFAEKPETQSGTIMQFHSELAYIVCILFKVQLGISKQHIVLSTNQCVVRRGNFISVVFIWIQFWMQFYILKG